MCQALTFDMRIDRWDGDFMAFFEREGSFFCVVIGKLRKFSTKKSKKKFQGVTFPRGHEIYQKYFHNFLKIF